MEAKFNKIYENQSYFDRYNGSVLGATFLLFIFFIVFSYAYIQTRITPIRNNWTQERCSPAVIPFAGMINAPANTDKFKFTADNFNYCIKSIIKESASFAVKPVEAVVKLMSDFINGIEDAINDIRKIMSGIRTTVDKVSRNIMDRILNVLIPFQQMMIIAKDTMSKSHAVLVTGMNVSLASIITLMSGLFNLQNFINAIIIAATATIAGMWFIPFVGFEMAIAATAALAAVTVPLGLISGAMGTIEMLTGLKPSCFKKGTLIRAANGTLYSIESIPIGTRLMRGGEVTAVLKLDAKNETMYKLGNVTVSGTHKVLYEKKWINVSEHPNAVKKTSFNEPYIYCLNTSGKKIYAGDYTFMDWDEISNQDLHNYGCVSSEDIHENVENGFGHGTYINIKNKGRITIFNVEVGDVLTSGEIVRGIVKIKNNKELYDYGNFTGTYGLSKIQHLGKTPTKLNNYSPIIYHLLTNTCDFHIEGQKIKDYNWNVDFFNV